MTMKTILAILFISLVGQLAAVAQDNENPRARVKGVIFRARQLAPHSDTTLQEMSRRYKVEFDINVATAEKGTILFHSPDATFYLTDPQYGKIGFSKGGSFNTFNYTIPVGKIVRLAIVGNGSFTRLYVNGRLHETLQVLVVRRNDDIKNAAVKTLVFPLQTTGNFNGKITNMTVTAL